MSKNIRCQTFIVQRYCDSLFLRSSQSPHSLKKPKPRSGFLIPTFRSVAWLCSPRSNGRSSSKTDSMSKASRCARRPPTRRWRAAIFTTSPASDRTRWRRRCAALPSKAVWFASEQLIYTVWCGRSSNRSKNCAASVSALPVWAALRTWRCGSRWKRSAKTIKDFTIVALGAPQLMSGSGKRHHRSGAVEFAV